ncbi:MAG: general secretion pathway protein GspK [Curvibacter sp.]|nr:general secretion pathway protein GspK [Curvibacter sp.]
MWLVAALSLVVTGVVKASRKQIAVTAEGRQIVVADAAARGAMTMVLQRLQTMVPPPARMQVVTVNFAGMSIEVRLIPMNGFINLNKAPAPLLAKLFRVAAGVSPDLAQSLAQLIVDAREAKDGKGVAVGIDAPEDLLQLPGFDYELYAKIKSLVVAGSFGSGRVNANAAPLEVLRVLADGNASIAEQIDRSRMTQSDGVDLTRLSADDLDPSTINRYLLTARVPLADGRWLLSSRGVDASVSLRSVLPWRILSSSRVVEQPAPSS